jgi:hypothetical protein
MRSTVIKPMTPVARRKIAARTSDPRRMAGMPKGWDLERLGTPTTDMTSFPKDKKSTKIALRAMHYI